jgi:hypothetical protein
VHIKVKTVTVIIKGLLQEIFRKDLKLRKEGTKKAINREWQKLNKGCCWQLLSTWQNHCKTWFVDYSKAQWRIIVGVQYKYVYVKVAREEDYIGFGTLTQGIK